MPLSAMNVTNTEVVVTDRPITAQANHQKWLVFIIILSFYYIKLEHETDMIIFFMKSKSIRGDSVRALRSRAKSRKFQGRPEVKKRQYFIF